MRFFDVNAPDTSWRGTEDPIPVLFGRYPVTAFAYRFLTCRPLDGHARTDAGFLRHGTKTYAKSGRTAPYNYWPGWKRGLLLTRVPAFGLLPYSLAVYANERMEIADGFWWHGWGAALAWLPHAGVAAAGAARYVRDYRHERDYLAPIRRAAVATLRTRDGVRVEIGRDLVHARDVGPTGRLYLPPSHSLPDGDREALLTMVRERLGSPVIDARWNMEGARPHMELHVPPQPPEIVSWETMTEKASPVSPYLGESAHGSVSWELGDDSPHIGVAGGSGSGKSELVAWIVAQFMRGGAGVVVLDPKYASHRWLMNIPGVLYCTEAQQLHDTILWLDEELRRRGRISQRSMETFPRIVVMLEERNSMQTLLREHWQATKAPGMPMRSPALAALDRLASQGRSLGINVILAAQATAQVDIGSRNSFGAFALAGRLPQNAWRLVMGSGTRKPAISARPGRFGYIVAGAATVFQGAYPNLELHSARLAEWATQGEQILDMQALLQQQYTPAFGSSDPVTTADPTEEYVTLRDFAADSGRTVVWLRSRRDRDESFPTDAGVAEDGRTKLYRPTDLEAWLRLQEDAVE